SGDPSSLGQTPTNHPLLGAAIYLANGDLLFTGQLSHHTHPWLGDHAVADTTLLPATAFIELALHAAAHRATPHLAELTLHAPLILPAHPPAHPQPATPTPPGVAQPPTLPTHSRLSGPHGDQQPDWTLRATATLTDTAAPIPARIHPWPPTGAQPLDIDTAYP